MRASLAHSLHHVPRPYALFFPLLLLLAVFVDGQASAVPHLMLWSAGCYTATALFYSFKSGLQVGGGQEQEGMRV